jgi:hypothetical protein
MIFFFFWCSYQLEALDKAIRENTIVYLETGCGKTLIAIMLLRSYAYHLRKPSPYIAVFLVPRVVLVSQVLCCHFHLFYNNFANYRCILWWMISMWWLRIHCACLFIYLCILASSGFEKSHWFESWNVFGRDACWLMGWSYMERRNGETWGESLCISMAARIRHCYFILILIWFA